MRNLTRYTFLLLILLLYSCSSTRRTTRTVSPSGSTPSYAIDYLNRYSSLAVSEMRRTGIPASITLAQGMLESNYGRSTLATKGNNHFGIKCHNDWRGEKIYHDDNRRGECFRSYKSAEDSYRDHSDFLVNGSRYRDLFRLSSTDYKGWAHGLKKAGYATDPRYPELLIRKIEEYGLHSYDTGMKGIADSAVKVSAGTGTDTGTKAPVNVPPAVKNEVTGVPDVAKQQPTPAIRPPAEAEEPIKVISLNTRRTIRENNGVKYVVVEEGDTGESLAEKFQILSWEISRYNDLAPGAALETGQVIYLQLKRTKAAQGFSMHVVSAGETMQSISQKYAIRLSSLYKMNLMDEGSECAAGQKLRLR